MNNTHTQKKTSDCLYLTSFDFPFVSDCQGELTMPDYYPEIRRIVSVFEDALPDSRYISDENLELSGTVAFTVLYIGDDGSLTSVPYEAEYSQSIPLRGNFDGSSEDIFTYCTAEGAVCRPLGPRTLSLKAKVKSRICAYKKEDCTLKIQTDSGTAPSTDVRRTLERLDGEIPTVKYSHFSTTGNLTGEKETTSGAKPVFCRASVLIKDTSAGRDSVNVKGEVEVSCLALSGEGLYRTYVIRLPFEEHVSAEGAEPGDVTAAYGRVAYVNVSADSDGSNLSADCEYDVDVHVARPLYVPVTRDIYSTIYNLEQTKDEKNTASLICLKNASRSVSGEGKRKSKPTEGEHIIHCNARAQADRVELREGTVTFSGSCEFCCVIAAGGDCITETFSVPVKLEFSADGHRTTDDCIWKMHASPAGAECRLEGEKIFGKCELYIFAEAVGETKCAPVTAICEKGADRQRPDNATICVVYPEKGKSLWDIAKEERFSISECESINHVKREDLSDGTPLIVK